MRSCADVCKWDFRPCAAHYPLAHPRRLSLQAGDHPATLWDKLLSAKYCDKDWTFAWASRERFGEGEGPMSTIFIGGSRDVHSLPDELKSRLDTIMDRDHQVILGDANGTDKAVQNYLADNRYRNVTLFCSGATPRNNIGKWTVRTVVTGSKSKDYKFYAAKDREMAREADFGLMIWNGMSPGTLLNIVRLSQAGKIAILYDLPHKDIFNFKTAEETRSFILSCELSIRSDIEKRATQDERAFLANATLATKTR
jgi:hypothetical protein